ncbi:MAG: U4/U6.U5 tri-snRNP-associated protein 2 [Paramarteilia canceri]
MSSVQNSPLPQGPEKKREKLEKTCPYLDTINRNLIDFDFEKLCSISLATQNVYACLVCGRYFQGRGPKSHAYTHSLQLNHYVFLNLETKKFYCLPENYEFFDTSLEDIIYLLDPKYAKEDLEQLNTGRICRAFDGSIYHPGIIGVNNIKANDYSSVVLLALAHITIIRDYFLHEIQDKKLFLSKKNLSEVSLDPRAQLVLRFGQLLRKIWNMHLFKSHISPHEMLQLVSKLSKGKFQFTKQSDPLEFIVWFMNNLDAGLKLLTGKKSTLISKNFSGSLRVTKQKIPLPDLSEKEVKKLLKTDDYQEKQSVHRFYTLPIDLPAVPLYPNQKHDFQVPKQSLSSLLKKFDGKQIIEEKTYREIFHKKFTILDLPKYLIIFYKVHVILQ